MSDKIEYSRLLMKRSTTAGEVPTIPPVTAVTLNQFTPTDIFEGEFFLNSFDDLLWIRTENGILPISLSGTSGTTVIPQLVQVLNEGNYTGGFDILVNSGDTIIFEGLPTGTTTNLLGLDGSGNTIIVTGTTGGGGTNGTSGSSGSNGSDGSAGNNGSSGTSGTSGPEGSSGSSGISGSSGSSGISGTSGSSGADGSRGDSGSSGSSGVNGSSGSSGANGSSGSSGVSGIDGTSGSSGISGSSGSNGLSGVNGTNGTSGVNGLSNSFFNYKAKTLIYSGDPASGHLLWNNAIQSDTTEINISDTDYNGNNIDIFISNLRSGTTITIQSQTDHTDYQTWEIGTPVDNSTYWTLPVTLVTSTYIFSNNEDVLFIISQVPSGSSGSSGVSGSSGSSGVNGSNGNNGSSGSSGVSGTSGTSSTAGGGGVIGTHFEMIITGATILPVVMSPSSLGAGYGPSQNTASLIPFIPVRDTSITGVTADVAVVGATGVFKIVCYDSSSAGFPTNLIIESSELSGATTGFKTFSTSYTFSAGTQYWIGVYGSASTAMRLRNIGSGVGLLPIPNPSTTTTSAFSVMLNYTQGTYPTVPTTLTAGPSYRSAVEQVPFMQLNKI